MSDIRPHKFTHNTNNASHYASLIYCEYCGFVVHDSNRSDTSDRRHEAAKTGCPLNPISHVTYNAGRKL